MYEKTFKSTKKWQMGTMWHMTQNTQFYVTKQNLLRTLFLQPTRQRVFVRYHTEVDKLVVWSRLIEFRNYDV